jgi:hypothetical protein
VRQQLDSNSDAVIEHARNMDNALAEIDSKKATKKVQDDDWTAKKKVLDSLKAESRKLLKGKPINITAPKAQEHGVSAADYARAQHLRGLAGAAQEELGGVNTVRRTLQDSISKMEAELEKAKEEHKFDIGPFERAMDEYLVKIGVKRQAFYSGAFVGDHVRRCLRNALAFFAHLESVASSAAAGDNVRTAALKSMATRIVERHLPLWKTLSRLYSRIATSPSLFDERFF